MKVILTSDVKNIGRRGDQKEVKPGFARNFLLPRGLAVLAESAEGRQAVETRNKIKENRDQETAKITEIINKNQDLVLEFRKKVSKDGKLFAGLKSAEILIALSDKIGEKPISIEPNKAIKKSGNFKFSAKFSGGQTLPFTIKITALK